MNLFRISLFITGFIFLFLKISNAQVKKILISDTTYCIGARNHNYFNVCYEITIKTPIPDGKYEVYMDSSFQKLRISFTIVKQKLNGIVTYHFTHGKISKETPYTDDKINGIEKEYNYRGGLHSTSSYKKGKAHGIHTRKTWNDSLNTDLFYYNKDKLKKIEKRNNFNELLSVEFYKREEMVKERVYEDISPSTVYTLDVSLKDESSVRNFIERMDSIQYYPNLHRLYLSDMRDKNKISFSFDSLIELKLDKALQLKFLEVLAINSQYDTVRIPKQVYQFKNLKVLTIIGPHISISEKISELQQLQSLIIRLQSSPTGKVNLLPLSLSIMPALNWIELPGIISDDDIKVLGTIPNLTYLKFWQTGWENKPYIPEEIGQLKQLRHLEYELYFACMSTILSEPPYVHIPESFYQLKNLQSFMFCKKIIYENEMNTLKEKLPNCWFIYYSSGN
jgi:hypothetical protein